jgi:hypothetical protein
MRLWLPQATNIDHMNQYKEEARNAKLEGSGGFASPS